MQDASELNQVLKNLPEDLRHSALSKYLKLKGAELMVMVQDLKKLSTGDHLLVKRVEEELMGKRDVPDDMGDVFTLADNITVTRPGSGNGKALIATLATAGALSALGLGYWMGRSPPTVDNPPNFVDTDTDTVNTLRFEDGDRGD